MKPLQCHHKIKRSTIPVIGSKYTEAPRFRIDWNNIHAPKPEINILLNSFFSLIAIIKIDNNKTESIKIKII